MSGRDATAFACGCRCHSAALKDLRHELADVFGRRFE